MLLFGPIADMMAIQSILIITGVCMLLLIVALGLNKTLIREGAMV